VTRVVVGVHEDTNSNAAAVAADGRILGAVAEGRLSRVKYDAGYPHRALSWLASSGALRGVPAAPQDAPVDRLAEALREPDLTLVAANRYHPIPRILEGGPPDGQRDFRSPIQGAHVAWHALIHRSRRVRAAVEAVCKERLAARWNRDFDLVGHHVSHAASAYFTGPWPEATVVTCDNLGDGECARVFHGKDGQLQPLWSVGAWHSPGQFYGEVASYLGIDPMTAGKVTGLAARGKPEQAARILRERLRSSPDRRGFRGPSPLDRRPTSEHWTKLAAFPDEDVAAAAQKVLEEALLPFIKEAVRTTGCGHVALAGGVFANVTLNRLIAALPEVESLWVHPAMSDQGIALGAALLGLAHRGPLAPRAMDHVYYGPSFTDAECAAALEEAGVDAERPKDLADAAGELLAGGKVVCRFDGATEYGPRALGNRSILARPDHADVNDWLNEKLDRSEYMPFAPVTLSEHADSLYDDLDAVGPCLPFMTVSVPVKEPKDPRFAGVVHLDGTVRPQVLSPGENDGYRGILEAFHRRTGIPSLVNTSFNRHGEPIVNSPADAIATWRGAGLDALVLGPFLAVQG
jgi:carbamoyltransferase